MPGNKQMPLYRYPGICMENGKVEREGEKPKSTESGERDRERN